MGAAALALARTEPRDRRNGVHKPRWEQALREEGIIKAAHDAPPAIYLHIF
jgi:hypothetical protein